MLKKSGATVFVCAKFASVTAKSFTTLLSGQSKDGGLVERGNNKTLSGSVTVILWQKAALPLRYAFRTVSYVAFALNQRHYRYIFLLTHMRAGSTLFGHILASNPDVAGAGELWQPYLVEADLDNVVLRTCEYLRKPILTQKYVVDSICHNDIEVSDEVLSSD